MTRSFDAIIIGTGQAGPFLAGRLAANGKPLFGVDSRGFFLFRRSTTASIASGVKKQIPISQFIIFACFLLPAHVTLEAL